MVELNMNGHVNSGQSDAVTGRCTADGLVTSSSKKTQAVIGIASLVISALFAIASSYFAANAAHFARQSATAATAGVWPQLDFALRELSFDRNKIKIVVVVTNRGQTTALLDSMKVTIWERAGLTSWIEGFKGSLIAPNTSREQRLIFDRRLSVGGRVYDVVESINELGRLSCSTTYGARGLSDERRTDFVQFSYPSWHDKSIIGVGK